MDPPSSFARYAPTSDCRDRKHCGGYDSGMAIRKEWTEWHLTPRGWEKGSTRRDARGNDWRDEPVDRLLSYQHCELQGSSGPAKVSTDETWRTKDPGAPRLSTPVTAYRPLPRRKMSALQRNDDKPMEYHPRYSPKRSMFAIAGKAFLYFAQRRQPFASILHLPTQIIRGFDTTRCQRS
jgi:hypothetical protein